MASKISIKCPNCEKQYNIPEEQLGKRATCKSCGHQFVLSVDSSRLSPPPLPKIARTKTSTPERDQANDFLGELKPSPSDADNPAGDGHFEVHNETEQALTVTADLVGDQSERPKSFWEKAKDAGKKLHEANKGFLEKQQALLPLKFLHGPFGGVKPGSPVYLKLEDDDLIVVAQSGFGRKEVFRVPLSAITGTEVETAERMTITRIGAGLILAGPLGALFGGLGFKKKDKLLRLDFIDDEVESSALFGKGIGKSVVEVNGRIHDALREFRKRTRTPAIENQPIPDIVATDITESIQKLAALRDQGILSDDEFAAKKAELLSRM